MITTIFLNFCKLILALQWVDPQLDRNSSLHFFPHSFSRGNKFHFFNIWIQINVNHPGCFLKPCLWSWEGREASPHWRPQWDLLSVSFFSRLNKPNIPIVCLFKLLYLSIYLVHIIHFHLYSLCCGFSIFWTFSGPSKFCQSVMTATTEHVGANPIIFIYKYYLFPAFPINFPGHLHLIFLSALTQMSFRFPLLLNSFPSWFLWFTI